MKELKSAYRDGIRAGYISCIIRVYGYCECYEDEIFNPVLTERLTNPYIPLLFDSQDWEVGFINGCSRFDYKLDAFL